MQIQISNFVQDSLQTERDLAQQVLKSFGLSGQGFDGFSLGDLFGAPGSSAVASSAMRDVEQVRGWNFTAIMAKSLQFGLGSMAVYCPEWMAEQIAAQHGEDYKASKRVTGIEQFGVPEDWVTAPRYHRIAKLLQQPNPWCDQSQFLFSIAAQTEAHGICHILVLPNTAGLPTELWVIPRIAIQPCAPSVKYPEGSYRVGHLSRLSIMSHTTEQPESLHQALARIGNREYSAKNVIAVGLPSIVYIDDCINVSSAIADTLDTDRQLHVTRRNVLEKQMTTGPRLEPMPGVSISNEEWNKVLDEFEATNMGPDRAGTPWRAPNGLKVSSDQKNSREMEYVKSADQSRDHVLGQRLTPAAMMGLGAGGSYAQVVGLIKGNSRLVLQPLMRIYSGQLTIGLRRFFAPPQDEFMTILQAASIDDPEQKRQEFDLLVRSGAIKKGEMRQAFSMMPFGDERDEELASAPDDAAGAAPGTPSAGAAPSLGTALSGALDKPSVGAPEKNLPQISPSEAQATEKSASMGQLSRRQFMRNRTAILETISQFEAGQLRERTAVAVLKTLGLSHAEAQEFIDSVKDTPGTGAQQDMRPEASALFSRALSMKGFVDQVAHTTATSPHNGLKQPSEWQRSTGQYKKGRVMVGGLTIEFENPQGSIRSGRRPDGSRWTVEMQDHYGYIVGAVGYDKDQLDVFVKPETPQDFSGDVFVINQANADGSFDEHKCFVGCASKKEAIARYLDNYDDDWSDRILSVATLSLPQFKLWMLDPMSGPLSGPCTAETVRQFHSVMQPEIAAPLFTRALMLKDATQAQAPAPATPAQQRSMRDGDGDGTIYDGTPQEQPAPAPRAAADVMDQVNKPPQPEQAEQTQEATHRVMFEAAPDPNDTELTNRWRNVSNEDRIAISRDVVKEILPEVSQMLGVEMSLTEQLGGYLDDTNPSFAAEFPQGVEPAKFIQTMKSTGFILSQDSMMGISQNPIEGGEKVGFVTVDIPDGQDVHDLYMKIRSLDSSVQGHTTVGSQMLIVDFTGQSERIANLINSNLKVPVGYADGYAAFVSKDQYGYGDSTATTATTTTTAATAGSDQGQAAGLAEEQRRTNDLRRKASTIIEQRLSAIESARGQIAKALFAKALGEPAGVDMGDDEADPRDEFDPATLERAELIADILYDLFGEDAELQLANGLDFAALAAQFGKAWDEAKYNRHPQGSRYGGRFAPKNTAEFIAAAHGAIEEALKGNRSPDSASRLVDSLAKLTVSQLHEVKRKYNMKASGRTKKDLVAKIAARLDSGRRADHSVPSVADRSVTAAQAASRAAIGSTADAASGEQQTITERAQQLEAAARKNDQVAQLMNEAEYRPELAGQHARVAQSLRATADDLRAIPQETPEQAERRVMADVVDYLAKNPNSTISDIAGAVGVAPGPGADPMQSPLNRALVRMRDSGDVLAIESRWGEPRFRLLDQNGRDAIRQYDRLKGVLPPDFAITQSDNGQLKLVTPNQTYPLPTDPVSRVQVLERQLRRRGYEPSNLINGIEESSDQRQMRANFNRKSEAHQERVRTEARARLEQLADRPISNADVDAHLFNLRPNDPLMQAANDLAIRQHQARRDAIIGIEQPAAPSVAVAEPPAAPTPAPSPRFTGITDDRDLTEQINRTLDMQVLDQTDVEGLFDMVPNMQHEALAAHIANRVPSATSMAQNVRDQRAAEIQQAQQRQAQRQAESQASQTAAAPAEPAAPAARRRTAALSDEQKRQLKKIGADFLDDITPDADGNLIQYRPSKGTVIIQDFDSTAQLPSSWDQIPADQQHTITESYRSELRRTLRNSATFKAQVRAEAYAEAERRVNAIPNEQLAPEVLRRMQRLLPMSTAGLTESDVVAMLNANETRAATSAMSVRNSKINDEVKGLLDGRRSWMRQRYQQELANRTANPQPSDLFAHARAKGMLAPVGATRVDQFLQRHGLKRQDLASIIGLPDDWEVKARFTDYAGNDAIHLEVLNGTANMDRYLKVVNGKLELKNSSFFMNDAAPKGLGLDIFSRSVAAAQKLGITKISTMPCRSTTMVGYAVWPQFGYDAPIESIMPPSYPPSRTDREEYERTNVRELVRQTYPNARTIRDIFDTPGGQEWWWKNGTSIMNATFDVTPGSRNMKALQGYMSYKKSARDAVRQQPQNT